MQEFKSPIEAFLYWEKTAPSDLFLHQPTNGKVITYTFAEAGQEARKMASALQHFGLSKGDHVALLSKNCAHWIIADLAIMMAGCISIPIYPTLNDKSIKQILEHSDSKAIIIGKLDNFESQKKGIPNFLTISIGLYGVKFGKQWEDLQKAHQPLQEITLPNPEDLHTIIYTSGTTGTPKGVMHTVNNFTVSSKALVETIKMPKNCRQFSYLPLAHVAERAICNNAYVLGSSIYFSDTMETFAKDLENCQPHFFFAVPRIWTKFREKILESIPQKKLNILLNVPILNTMLKNKLKKKLGLREAIFIVSAAAPIADSLVRWFKKLDIHIMQGYGMTEDCCVSHFNTLEDNKVGTVGKTLSAAKAKLSSEGEICIKNNCLMKGYYKAPDLTAEMFDDDGYLKTGDIGEYDHDGFLSITGRVKDQFKTDKGKYISPSLIELAISKNTDIEQICIVGTGIPQPIALITLSELGKSKPKEALSKSLMETVSNVNPKLEKHEKVEKVVIMKEDWTVENGLATPSLKLKRNAIEKIHQPYYNQWFKMEENVIFE
jgi:long-chain acyl-CoA synthetase